VWIITFVIIKEFLAEYSDAFWEQRLEWVSFRHGFLKSVDAIVFFLNSDVTVTTNKCF
jgi:hypothetical protein